MSLDDELARVAADNLRGAATAVSLLFAAFGIYNAIAFPSGVREPMVAYDLVLVGLGAAVRARCGPSLALYRAQLAGAALSAAVLGNIVAAAVLGASPLFMFYVSILVVASVGSMLSRGWALGMGAFEVLSAATAAVVILPREALVTNLLVLLSSAAGAFVVHSGRARAHARILALRAEDARREVSLQAALRAADEARAGLDRKVAERTAALREELEQRGRLEEQLRHAQKLDAIGRLAGGIAHDFNNLLTVIRMSLDTLGDPAGAVDAGEALRDATDATERAAALTHDLLAFARKQALARTQVRVADILAGVERMVRRLVEASVRFDVHVDPEAGEVIADARQIEQVLLNLAINACDAMDNRGTLTMTTDVVSLDATAAASHGLAPGRYVRIAVTDTGTGMDEATMRSVFEPFFTTKDVGRGTGLGLAVAHGIVSQHDGQIEVASELGVGSTFTVFLPRARAQSAPQPIVTSRAPGAAEHETVVVVEDEPAVRRAIERSLERLGYRVIVARDGEHALELVAGLDHFDLLVSDVVMPGIDGAELAGRLRARWPKLPVLFLTGYSSDRLAGAGVVGPRDRVLEKPYQQGELARTIRTMLATDAPPDQGARSSA